MAIYFKKDRYLRAGKDMYLTTPVDKVSSEYISGKILLTPQSPAGDQLDVPLEIKVYKRKRDAYFVLQTFTHDMINKTIESSLKFKYSVDPTCAGIIGLDLPVGVPNYFWSIARSDTSGGVNVVQGNLVISTSDMMCTFNVTGDFGKTHTLTIFRNDAVPCVTLAAEFDTENADAYTPAI